MNALYAAVAGLIFGLGLILGGMTDPMKVKGFLDLFGAWDPSLALVMGGGIAVGTVGFALARRRTKSLSGEPIDWPTSTLIDARLLVGGVMFGLGWGLAGFCPGPALVAASSGFAPALWFIPAMLLGMWAYDRFVAKR